MVPGNPEDQSAFRSELAGLYGIVTATLYLCSLYEIKSGGITVACDGEVALDYSFDWDHKWLRASTPHLDLIHSIRTMIKLSPLQWKFRHVKGHQDDFVGPLDRWENLNVEMDQLAKDYWSTENGKILEDQSIRYEPWSIWSTKGKFITPMRGKIYNCIHQPLLDKYWHHRKRFKKEDHSAYDWEGLADAMKRQPLTRRHWLTKHSSGWCSVGKMAKR